MTAVIATRASPEHLVDEPPGPDVFHTKLQLGYEQLSRASRMEALSDAVVHKRNEAGRDDYAEVDCQSSDSRTLASGTYSATSF